MASRADVLAVDSSSRRVNSAGPTKRLTDFILQHFESGRRQLSSKSSALIASALVSSLRGAGDLSAVRIAQVAHRISVAGTVTPPGDNLSFDVVTCAMVTAARARAGGFVAMHPDIGPASIDVCGAVAWSVGQQERATWSDIVAAFAAGLEAQLRVALALKAVQKGTHWDVPAMTSVIGAAYTAGLLRGLEDSALAQAIGIAASQTVGTPLITHTSAGILHSGKPASNAVLSAYLAANQFTGSATILEVHRGFFAVVAEAKNLPENLTFPDQCPRFSDMLELVEPATPTNRAEDWAILSAPYQRLLSQIDRIDAQNDLRTHIVRFAGESI